MRRLTPLVVLAVAVIVAIVAGSVAGGRPAVALSPSDAANELSHEVMSPFCPGLTLASCPSPSAFELRTEIRARFDAGESREVIFEDLVRRFGRGIKGTPDASGLGALVWVIPFVGAAVLGVAIRSATRARGTGSDRETALTGSSPSAHQLARFDEELEQLD